MQELTEQDGGSLDMVNENLKALKTTLPEAFNEDGVNFDMPRQLLGDAIDEGKKIRPQLAQEKEGATNCADTFTGDLNIK